MRNKLKQTAYDRIESIFESHIKSHSVSKLLMCNLKSANVQTLIDEIRPNYSYSTIKKVYLFFHSMIKYGIAEDDFPKTYDPLANIELPDEIAAGVKTKSIQIIPEESIEQIKFVALSYNSDGILNYRYGPALVFILNTGLREGELLALSKNGIAKDKKGHISIQISETISTVKNQETLDRILRKCKLPHYGTHALRHTFATRLLSKTSSHQDIKAVAELLGDDYKVMFKYEK